MLFNKDPKRSVTVRLESDPGGGPHVLHGDLQLEQYSGQQYAWDPTPGDDSHGRDVKLSRPARMGQPRMASIQGIPPVFKHTFGW